MTDLGRETVVSKEDLSDSLLLDEVVMFDGTAGKYYATSSVGADIWDTLETPISVSKIVIWLVEMYDVDGTVCLEEVVKFLRELDYAGLLS